MRVCLSWCGFSHITCIYVNNVSVLTSLWLPYLPSCSLIHVFIYLLSAEKIKTVSVSLFDSLIFLTKYISIPSSVLWFCARLSGVFGMGCLDLDRIDLCTCCLILWPFSLWETDKGFMLLEQKHYLSVTEIQSFLGPVHSHATLNRSVLFWPQKLSRTRPDLHWGEGFFWSSGAFAMNYWEWCTRSGPNCYLLGTPEASRGQGSVDTFVTY